MYLENRYSACIFPYNRLDNCIFCEVQVFACILSNYGSCCPFLSCKESSKWRLHDLKHQINKDSRHGNLSIYYEFFKAKFLSTLSSIEKVFQTFIGMTFFWALCGNNTIYFVKRSFDIFKNVIFTQKNVYIIVL